MAKSGTKILFGFVFFVLLVGGLAGGGAWYLTEHRVEGYRATATLLLDTGFAPGPMAPPPSEQGPGMGGPMGSLRHDVKKALGMDPKAHPAPQGTIAPPDYATLFRTDAMAAQLKDGLGAIYTETGVAPKEWTLEEVRHAMEAKTQVALQTHDNVVYRRVVSLEFTAEAPEVASAAANAWAEAAKSFAASIAQEDREARSVAIQSKLDAMRGELDAAVAVQDELLQGPDVDGLAQSASEQAEAARALKEHLQSLEQTLARDEAALTALKSYVSKAPVAVVMELSVTEANLEATLAGSRAERDYVAQRVAALAPVDTPDAPANRALARRKLEEAEATVDRVKPVIAALEDAKSANETLQDPVRIAAKAITPESPAGPHRYVLVGGAALLGAVLGMILYFALLTLRVYARELDRA